MSISVKKVKIAITALAIPLITVLILLQSASQVSGSVADEISILYNSKCAICHGADGSGNTMNGKKLSVRDVRSAEIEKMSDAQLIEIVAKGKGKMPAYQSSLGKEKIERLIIFMRGLAQKN